VFLKAGEAKRRTVVVITSLKDHLLLNDAHLATYSLHKRPAVTYDADRKARLVNMTKRENKTKEELVICACHLHAVNFN
jgi:hypothetical protein